MITRVQATVVFLRYNAVSSKARKGLSKTGKYNPILLRNRLRCASKSCGFVPMVSTVLVHDIRGNEPSGPSIASSINEFWRRCVAPIRVGVGVSTSTDIKFLQFFFFILTAVGKQIVRSVGVKTNLIPRSSS